MRPTIGYCEYFENGIKNVVAKALIEIVCYKKVIKIVANYKLMSYFCENF